MATLQEIKEMTLKQRRQHLSVLRHLAEPTASEQREIEVLREAIKIGAGWKTTELPHPKTEPEKKPEPTIVNVTVNAPVPPSTPSASSSYIPTSPVGAVVHLAETILDKATRQKPLDANTVAMKVAERIAADQPSTNTVPPRGSSSAQQESLMSTKTIDLTPTSGITIETNRLVKSVGAIILAGGIIGVMIWQLGAVEFMNMLLYVALPVMALLVAFRLMRYATLEMVWNMELEERVKVYYNQMKDEATAPRTTGKGSTAHA